MRPAGFMSKKFTDAQRSYFTYEHETLGVIEALKKWDDDLLGLAEIWIIMDHEALKTFMQKAHTGPRQIRWSQWFTQYRLKFLHVPGSQNRSADALSRKFENPNSAVSVDDLSTVDLLLDKDGDDLTDQRLKERDFLQIAAMTRKSRLGPPHTRRDYNAVTHREEVLPHQDIAHPDASNGNLTIATSTTSPILVPFDWWPDVGSENRPDLRELCQNAYASDKTF